MLLASNKQHKEIPKTERQNTQKRTVGKNKDQLHYNMHTQFMCPYIPFQTSLTGQKRWDIVHAGHSSSLPNKMHTKFICPSLYHFPNSSYRSEEMGTLVMPATVKSLPNNCTLYSLSLEPHPQNSQKHGRNKYIVFQ
jgi:hypothetical protein